MAQAASHAGLMQSAAVGRPSERGVRLATAPVASNAIAIVTIMVAVRRNAAAGAAGVGSRC